MLFETGHPLIQHKVGRLRSSETAPLEFRRLVRELSLLLCYEATRDLQLVDVDLITPMGDTKGSELHQRIGLVPILRAGLGMVDGLLDLLPLSQVWHIGLYRNEETLQPVTYYNKLPESATVDMCLVLDPMLATGGSAIATVDIIKEWGVPTIKFVGLIAAPEGIKALEEAHPDVDIHVAAVDSHLNDIGYIVPGLGDAGDRQFNTL